ncbi:ATP-dependent Clp protease proteolytic subunit [Candidatus Desantisbacteria bacterium]|nr:ATP-dependent Clp protease proteolytic subunit [Candidatus Desantisbacteria bacterium]
MPNWNQVLDEIKNSKRADALDFTRRKYIKKLNKLTGRNIISYYSGWLQKRGIANAGINDDDKNGLMATIHGLDRSKGLDLILHTPGGELTATESIVFYLREMFGTDIRTFIPQIAMSAGTMIACSCKEIIMGKQSNLGPIDPQFGGIPAYGVISEFERALKEIKADPSTIPIWQTIVGKYHPTFLGECQNAIELSTQMVTKWLETGMFKGESNSDKIAKSIVQKLNDHDDTKTHDRHIHIDEAIKIGLKIKPLEENQNLQDTVLTIHHAFMHTFANSQAIKIIENHLGKAIVYLYNPNK